MEMEREKREVKRKKGEDPRKAKRRWVGEATAFFGRGAPPTAASAVLRLPAPLLLLLRLLHVLLPRLDHLRRHFRRRFLIGVELLPVGPVPVRQGVQGRGVAVELGLR